MSWVPKDVKGNTVRGPVSTNQQFASPNGKDGMVMNPNIASFQGKYNAGPLSDTPQTQEAQAPAGQTVLGQTTTKRRGQGMVPALGPADQGNKTMLGA